MTNEEAKECLTHLEWLAEDIQKHLSIGYLADLDLCREALEKQIPKKPVICVMEWISQPVEAKCPNCGELVCKYDAWARATMKEHHCKCGQCIDWSDSNDN